MSGIFIRPCTNFFGFVSLDFVEGNDRFCFISDNSTSWFGGYFWKIFGWFPIPRFIGVSGILSTETLLIMIAWRSRLGYVFIIAIGC